MACLPVADYSLPPLPLGKELPARRIQNPGPVAVATLPLLPADEVSFGQGVSLAEVAPTLTRWQKALAGGSRQLREGVIPNAVFTGLLVAGSALLTNIPMLAAASVPVLLAPTFFVTCCALDGIRGMAFGAYPHLDPAYWLSKIWQKIRP